MSLIQFRLAAVASMMAAGVCRGQQPIGTLPTDAATIAGLVSVSAGTASIQNNGVVTAGARTAQIALHRGGSVAVCASSTVHLSQSNASVESAPLLIALERGAAEMRWSAQRADVIMTPDLRLELSDAAPLDLRIRVIANGDTCIENAGKDAPLLHVTEQFGVGGYLIKPEQRVLFEHGSLREVVDKEMSGCGCPAVPAVVLAANGTTVKSAEVNPFPEAVSAGLEPSHVPAVSAGEIHAQVAATLAYNGSTDAVAGPPEPASTAGATSAGPASFPPVAAVKPASTAPPASGPRPLRAIGHFFRRLFGGSA